MSKTEHRPPPLVGAWLSADSVTKLVCSQTWQGWPTLRREEEPPKLRGSGGWEVGGGIPVTRVSDIIGGAVNLIL